MMKLTKEVREKIERSGAKIIDITLADLSKVKVCDPPKLSQRDK